MLGHAIERLTWLQWRAERGRGRRYGCPGFQYRCRHPLKNCLNTVIGHHPNQRVGHGHHHIYARHYLTVSVESHATFSIEERWLLRDIHGYLCQLARHLKKTRCCDFAISRVAVKDLAYESVSPVFDLVVSVKSRVLTCQFVTSGPSCWERK